MPFVVQELLSPPLSLGHFINRCDSHSSSMHRRHLPLFVSYVTSFFHCATGHVHLYLPGVFQFPTVITTPSLSFWARRVCLSISVHLNMIVTSGPYFSLSLPRFTICRSIQLYLVLPLVVVPSTLAWAVQPTIVALYHRFLLQTPFKHNPISCWSTTVSSKLTLGCTIHHIPMDSY